MLHAGPQTEVKEEFLHLTRTMELPALQSCYFVSLPPNKPPATILSTVHFNGFFLSATKKERGRVYRRVEGNAQWYIWDRRF